MTPPDPPNAPFPGVFICSLYNWPLLLPPFYFAVLEYGYLSGKMSAVIPNSSTSSLLRQEYEQAAQLFGAQPPLTQRFIEAQAQHLAEAIVQRTPQVHFALPSQIALVATGRTLSTVPVDYRDQAVGGSKILDRLARVDVHKLLRQRLAELEHDPQPEVSISATLLRYTTVIYMVHLMLPAGRSVKYEAVDGEEIPTLPQAAGPSSALTATTDAIVEDDGKGNGRGELLVPYSEAARKFYLPQWVALDEQNRLLVNTLSEAEAHLASMQQYMEILHLARALAPYIVADTQYQQKRYGMLGQLINQGRALARYEMNGLIAEIRTRAAHHDLNRGLSLSVPYFDDQALTLEQIEFVVIPTGRVMFVPAFVVKAAREEQAKVSDDTHLNASTRHHALQQLKRLEYAFDDGAGRQYQMWEQQIGERI
jgi:hypothetical protein